MGGPNDITRGKDGNFYIAEQEDAGKPAYVCVRDGQENVLARLESRHVHGVCVEAPGRHLRRIDHRAHCRQVRKGKLESGIRYPHWLFSAKGYDRRGIAT